MTPHRDYDPPEPMPGSRAAIADGCECCHILNDDGDGAIIGGWMIQPGCPLHWREEWAA